MNSISARLKKAVVGFTLVGVLMSMFVTPSHSDGPLVPAPKTPPPKAAIQLPDGSYLYPDGSILYPDGTYLYTDGCIYYPNGPAHHESDCTGHPE